MKNIFKNSVRRRALFDMFCKSLLSSGLEDRLDSRVLLLHLFSLLQDVILMNVCEGKPFLPHTCSWERGEFSVAFSDNCGHDTLMTHQNLTSGAFLKV